MKNFGLVLMWGAVALFCGGFVLLHGAMTPPEEQARLLAEAQNGLRFCFAADCSASEALVLRRQQELAEAMPDPLPGYVLAGSAPFFFIVGTILFAAGKVEQAVRAERAA